MMTTTDRRPLTRLLNITEVADVLNVDVRHVRRLVHERRIPYLKWGHLLRFDSIEIEAWLDQG
jgi:excisionase family DNA binding protein